ncbi:queuosine precursor transporter [Haloferax profundi]|uniref:Probable queuosine precursor transporter n=1 Tax=Haloferax profundi TaxID=1544718 RepID=A0A0W1SSM8_9EURY|nr:queuosine precursor transporter [Haloferax profundi]KTG29400.1 integral membrane-like protein [Haloferax profundi]
MSEGHSNVGQVVLVGLFVTALATAQLTASKLLAIPLPSALGELPLVGATIVLPGAALAYALTFFASDCYSELYGRRPAQVMVNVGFAMNFVLLGLVWSTIAAPAANPEFAANFADVLASGTNIVAGSLLAYLVSQNWDVIVFHGIRDLTDGAFLWLRNIVSTATSQAIDTVIFVGVAFYVAPTVLGIGQALPRNVLVSLIVGQYLLKLLIAIVDTPLVYGVVALFGSESSSSDDGWVAD